MGLDINAVQFLIAARKQGVCFGDVLMLGRQDLNVYPAKMRSLLRGNGIADEMFQPGAPDTMFAEPVFRSLGASEVYSLDASAFEGASFVHDLNRPTPENLRRRFDLVYDGGTLEHVFNFPVALQNAMEMLREGGRLFIHTVTNSYCGHGLYQFSPELFFRALSKENGFELERMVLHRIGPYGRWYEVSDPAKIGSRVALMTFCPVQLLIQAQRTQLLPIFAAVPQQSDYTPRWRAANAGISRENAKPPLTYAPSRPLLAKWFPGLARLLHVIKVAVVLYQQQTLRNRKCFRPIKRGA